MKYILFTLIFSIFSLCAKNLQPLTHEEVKHFRVLNAQAIHAAKGASGYDAIGIFALCKQELEAHDSVCICPLSGNRVEYFSRLSAAVSLGIGFDAGIINKPMNSSEAGVFKGMAKALGNQLQRAAVFVTLADVSSGFERAHLQGFDNAIKTGTMMGPHAIDLGQVAAEKANAPLRAKLAREYADLPRVNTYDQPFEVALLARVISSNPLYTAMLTSFLNNITLGARLQVSLAAKEFLGILGHIATDQISSENLESCLEVFSRVTDYNQILSLLSALQLSKRHADERRMRFDTSIISILLPKLHRMRGNIDQQLDFIARQFPGLSPSQFPDFSGYVASESNQQRKQIILGVLLRSLAREASDERIDAIKKVFSVQGMIPSIRTPHLGRFLVKAIELVKEAEQQAEKVKTINALKRIAGTKMLEIFPAGYVDPEGMLEKQMDQFIGIFRFVAILPDNEREQFNRSFTLLLEAPEGDSYDDTTGELLAADDPFAADRDNRIQLIAALARPSIIRFSDSLTAVIKRIGGVDNSRPTLTSVADFSITESKLNAIEALLSLGQDPTDVASLIELVYQFPEDKVGLEPVARLAERMYEQIIFNEGLPLEFRNEHSHLNFALTLLSLEQWEQNYALEEYIRDPQGVLRQALIARRRAQGLQTTVVADAGRRVDLRTTGCMAVHRVGALLCAPLERALDAVMLQRRLTNVSVENAYDTLTRWIEAYGKADLPEDTAAKVRFRAAFARARGYNYSHRDRFDGTLQKVIVYLGGKSKAEKDAWLTNSLGEASQAYDSASLNGGISCDKGLWERLLLGLKYQNQPEFDNLLAIIDLGDLTTNSFNTMQRLQSPGIDSREKNVEASTLWKLWDSKTPPLRNAHEAVILWEGAIEQMRAEKTTEVMELLRVSQSFLITRYYGAVDNSAYEALLGNFLEHVNGTADRIKRDWKQAIKELFTRYQDIKAGIVV